MSLVVMSKITIFFVPRMSSDGGKHSNRKQQMKKMNHHPGLEIMAGQWTISGQKLILLVLNNY